MVITINQVFLGGWYNTFFRYFLFTFGQTGGLSWLLHLKLTHYLGMWLSTVSERKGIHQTK